MKKFIIISSFLILLLILVSDYLIKNAASYAIIKPGRTGDPVVNMFLAKNYRKMVIITSDSIKLTGYFIPAESANPFGTVIILHGVGGNKESQLGIAKTLSRSGFNAVIPDLRGHGESGGLYCTYGYYEKRDIACIIDSIKSITHSDNIAIMGTSLGGAVAVQALAVNKNIKCGIIISTFSSLNEISYDYMLRMFHIPFKFVSDMALNQASVIAKFPGNKINPGEYAAKINQPVLYIHGSEDERIDIKYGREIFNNLKSEKKKFYVVKGAHHNDISTIGGAEYENEIIKFLLLNMGSSEAKTTAGNTLIMKAVLP